MQKSNASWKQVKKLLSDFDPPALLSLIHDLYAAHKDNQAFLHARFSLGEDVLEPYKETIHHWLTSVPQMSPAKARQAVAAYNKAGGDAAGLAELMVYFCECCADFSDEFGYSSGAYFNALVNMFENALEGIASLAERSRGPLIARLREVRAISEAFGYGVDRSMDALLSRHSALKPTE